jgi:hypothetical protein
MRFSTSIIFSLAATVIARPHDAVTAAAAGSKKNVYLSSCTSRSLLDSRWLLIKHIKSNTHSSAADTASAVIYYNGPASSWTSPSDIGVVSEPSRKWEGVSRRTTLSDGRFTSSIAAGADGLPKSQIAGSATLDTEAFVCFVDGKTARQTIGVLVLMLAPRLLPCEELVDAPCSILVSNQPKLAKDVFGASETI